MKKISFITLAVLFIALAAVALRLNQRPSSGELARAAHAGTVVVHKTPACGCCGNYISYLKREGFTVDVQNHDDLSAVKAQYGIPAGFESCHTALIGDYVAEGHIPSASIEKMLKEKPRIAGIALPGMPAGSPGMGGWKNGFFTVYGFTAEGDTSTFDTQ